MLEDGDNFIKYFDQIVLLAKQLTSTPVYNPVQPSTRSGRLSTMILRFSRLTLAVLSIRGTYETNILMKSGNRWSFVLYHTWYDNHSIPLMINLVLITESLNSGKVTHLIGLWICGIHGRRYHPSTESCESQVNIQVQLMDFFDNREKLKAEFGEYYEKSLKKKWAPGTPETTTNTTYQ